MAFSIQKIIPSFSEVVRRIPHHASLWISQRLQEPAVIEGGEVFAFEIKRKPLIHCIQSEETPFYALSAFQRSRIACEQLATTLMVCSTKRISREFSFSAIPLFKRDGSVNERATEIFEKTFVIPKSKRFSGSFILSAERRMLESEKIKEIFRVMQEAPVSERMLLQYEDPTAKEFAEGRSVTLADATCFIGFNVFSRILPENLHFPHMLPIKRIIPSFSLMQAFLDVKFENDAVMMRPVLGTSTVQDLLECEKQYVRDVQIPFPGLEPTSAHKYKTLGHDFSYHDFYHSYLISCIGKEHTLAFLKLAEEYFQDDKKPYFEQLFHSFIDLDMPYYRKEIRVAAFSWNGTETKALIFWVVLDTVLRSTFKSDLVAYREFLQSPRFFRVVDDIFFTKRTEWEALNVTRDGVFDAEKRLERILSDKFSEKKSHVAEELMASLAGVHLIKILSKYLRKRSQDNKL